jgi:hypothetical protein
MDLISREWLPSRVAIDLRVDWCWFGDQRLVEPFFTDSLVQRMRLPFNLAFRHRTDQEALDKIYHADPGIEPTGFIFHMSRCGSTLVSQMFAALSRAIVVSESPVFDEVLTLPVGGIEKVRLLRGALNAYARPRFGEDLLFIKFDSWTTRELALIREAYPTTPWVFLYRDPVEVIVSHMRSPGSQMIPGNMARLLPELDAMAAVEMGRERYCSRVLAEFCKNAIAASDPNGMFVNYDELPAAVNGRIAGHFGLELSARDLAAIVSASARNAKAPREEFRSDTEEKRAEATTSVREAADEFLTPIYEELRNL